MNTVIPEADLATCDDPTSKCGATTSPRGSAATGHDDAQHWGEP